MLTMFELENPQLIFDIKNNDSSLLPKSIKESVDQWFSAENLIITGNDIVNFFENDDKIAIEYKKTTQTLRIKYLIKEGEINSPYFDDAVIIINAYEDKTIKLEIVFKSKTPRKEINIIKLKEKNSDEEFIKNVFSEKDIVIDTTELNHDKIKEALKSIKENNNAFNVVFNIDEMMSCKAMLNNTSPVSYHPIKNSAEKELWYFSFYTYHGIYYEELDMTFKGAVFKRKDKGLDWVLTRVDFYPGKVDLEPEFDVFRYEVLFNKATIINNPDFSVTTKNNEKIIISYEIEKIFKVNFSNITFPEWFCLYGVKRRIKDLNDESEGCFFSGETITNDLFIQLFFNYLMTCYSHKEFLIKDLFNNYLQGEIDLENLTSLLDINLGFFEDNVDEIYSNINYIISMHNEIKSFIQKSKSSDNPFKYFFDLKKSLEVENVD